MIDNDISGTAEISDEGIKKHFKSIDPWAAIFELVWNGLDANASTVDVEILENNMHSVEAVYILDNGDGIDFENAKDNFGKFNDSHKKEDAAQHGLHGRGRLAFHRLCHEAIWYTKTEKGIAKITVKGSNIKRYSGSRIQPEFQHEKLAILSKGTCVELAKFHENLPALKKLHAYFSTEFGWYLALNPKKHIHINSVDVTVPTHEIFQEVFNAGSSAFDVKIIRWDEKPASEKSFTYLLNSHGITVYKQLSSFNHKANFFTSIYIQSPWADTFVAGGADLLSGSNNNTDSDNWADSTLKCNFCKRI